MLVLGGAVALMGVDGVNSLLLDLRLPHLYQPHNLLRLATGLGTGVAMAAFLIPVANGLLWREESEQSSFGRFGQLAVMAPVLLLAFLAVGSQTDFLLYPIAILSSAGLALALTLINLVVMLGITNRIGRFATWRQVLPLFTLALALAVMRIDGALRAQDLGAGPSRRDVGRCGRSALRQRDWAEFHSRGADIALIASSFRHTAGEDRDAGVRWSLAAWHSHEL